MGVKTSAVLFLVFFVVLLIAAFVLWLCNHSIDPVEMWFPMDYKDHTYVESAALVAIDPSSSSSPPNGTSTLRYDLSVYLTLRNDRPRKLCYRDIAATVSYNGSMLGVPDNGLPTPFCQKNNRRTGWLASFRGTVAVYSVVASEAERERAAGMLHFTVRVSGTLVGKESGRLDDDVYFYNYDCDLWFPPPSHGAPALFAPRDSTKCRADKW